MVKLKKKEIFKLNKNLKLDVLINDIADGFNKSFQDGIAKTSTDINGKKFKVTNNPTPLLDKGKMKNIYLKEKAKKGNQKAVISMNRRDREVPSVVHNQGLAPQKLREWFGVSVRAVKQANKYINLEINRLLRK